MLVKSQHVVQSRFNILLLGCLGNAQDKSLDAGYQIDVIFQKPLTRYLINFYVPNYSIMEYEGQY